MGLFQEEKKKHNLEDSGNTHKKKQVHNQLIVGETDEGNLGNLSNLQRRKKEDDMGGLLMAHWGR